MADPKYADLPGIAYDQPDIYETADLPECNQSTDFFEEETDSIERLHISASEAFIRFKGRTLDGKGIDFSDRLSTRLRIGYDARSGDWELVESGEKETLFHKYQRLQCEMKELEEEITHLKETAKDEQDLEKLSSVLLSSHVEVAQKQLAEVRLEETLGSELMTSLADPQGSQLRRLIAQLEKLKLSGTPSQKLGNIKTQPAAQSGTVTYELTYRPEQAYLMQVSRVADLEHRLHKLETVLGATSDKVARLSLDTQHKSLVEVAQELNAKANVLDSAQLDHIEGRLTALAQKMDSINEKTAATPEDIERNHKVNELYELVTKTETLAQVLPQTVDRLLALESLHRQAVDFNKSLTQLEALQQQIINSLQNNDTMMKDVQTNVKQNLDAIVRNMRVLEVRIVALKIKK
jgi:dynactin-2